MQINDSRRTRNNSEEAFPTYEKGDRISNDTEYNNIYRSSDGFKVKMEITQMLQRSNANNRILKS